MTKHRGASPLDRHRVPAPPPELEARVAAAAAIAARRELEQRGWIDTLWDSRSARLIWAASAGVLLLANLVPTGPVGPPVAPVSPGVGVALAAAFDGGVPALAGETRVAFVADGFGGAGFTGVSYLAAGGRRRGDLAGAAVEWRRQVAALLESEGARGTTTAYPRRAARVSSPASTRPVPRGRTEPRR